MAGRWSRTAAYGLLAAVALGAVSGCSEDGPGSTLASQAASVAASAAADLSRAAQDAADKARQQLAAVKDGIDAKDEVTLGTPSMDGAGRTTVAVTARNTAGSSSSFAVQVDFKDADGKLVDTVVVTIADVPAGQSKEGTARSSHELPGTVTASVPTALRY
jgi:hypothetical protein